MSKFRIGAAALCAAVLVFPANAEVLQVSGEFPARYRAVSLLRSLAIGRIEGRDGPALGNAIERHLAGTHFQLLGGRGGRDNAEASLSGAVTGGSEETPFKRKEKRCVDKDKNGKCLKEAEVEVRCTKRIINLTANLRITGNPDGRILYSEQKPFRQEISWCEGQNAPQTVDEVANGAVEQMGREVRYDIAPYRETYNVRVRESTKGMSKAAADRFKALIKQTKRDARGACAGWEAMQGELGGNASLLFNLALCAEQRGDYGAARDGYEAARRAGASEGEEGASRANRLIAAREDAAARARN